MAQFIPLHPDLVVLLAEWTATNAIHIRAQRHGEVLMRSSSTA